MRRALSERQAPRGAGIGLAASTLATLLLLLALGTALAQPITDPDTDPRVREVAKDLQCPVCQNLSVADSPSGLAKDMRALIAKQLDEGQTREQIEQYFVERYGEGILLRPSHRGFTGLVWLGPWLALGLGLVLVALTLRRLAARRAVPTIQPVARPEADPADGSGETDRYERQLEAELTWYRERVG